MTEDELNDSVAKWFEKYMPNGMTVIVIPKEAVVMVEDFE